MTNNANQRQEAKPVYHYDKHPVCPWCCATESHATSTPGQIQWRKCVCGRNFKQAGRLVAQ